MFGRHYLKNYQAAFLASFRLLDIVLLIASASYAVPHLLSITQSGPVTLTYFLSGLTFILIADRADLYRPWRGKRLRYELLLLMLINSSTIGCVCLFLWMADFLDLNAIPTGTIFLWFILQTSLLGAVRIVVRTLLKLARRLGFNQRRIVFVGLSEQIEAFLSDLRRHPELGLQSVGYVDDRLVERTENASFLPKLGRVADLPKLIKEHDIDQVWFAYPVTAAQRMESGLGTLEHSAVAIRQILNSGSEPAQITGILGLPMIDIDIAMTDNFVGGLLKSTIDFVVAAFALVILSPLMLLIAIGVKLSSPGPVFYRQKRVTWKNETFDILKFRSMPVGAEFQQGETWASHHKQTTRFGEFLRASSLDELPQFINVLRGDMSIIGPRPERPQYVEQFKHEIPSYMKKHRVKAGITGWAQVNGLRGDTDLKARVQHDLYYIKHWSPLLDLKIALQTIFNGLFRSHS